MITKHLPGNSSADKILERQFRGRELTSHPHGSQTPHQAIREFVCISQAVGSGGSEVAALLGEKLHWPVFDKEILHAMAREDMSREQVYRTLDERDLSWFVEAFRSMMDTQFRRNDYFHRLVQTVFCIARRGPAIFVGRAADLILPQDRGLRVRIIAPLKDRVARFARENDLTEPEATEEIARKERDRAEWIRNHFHIAPEEHARWDLILNVGRLSTRQATELILAAWSMLPVATPKQAAVTS